ncbi:MAG: GIY-YIG nuclease family protein [Candidatus Pacebacteria bacterium]|nr:GIY-YIG nuclease family protein [Candidatus Paceibacterota bacterium]
MKYHVYAIFNRKHNKIYIGQTQNLEERLGSHNNKTFKGSYTAQFDGNWELVYKEEAEDRKRALIREKQLKTYQGRKFIKQFIPVWRNGSADAC